MKTTVLAIVLVCALAAAAQSGTQTQPPASGAPASSDQTPTMSGPEYNAYMAAIQQKDPSAKISALEAYLSQYPNSVMKVSCLELLMGAYQQTQNQAKVTETAKRVLTADQNDLRALALLTFQARQMIVAQKDIPQNLADLQTYCKKGLDAEKVAAKPSGVKDDEFDKFKKDTTLIFNGGCGFAALQSKDYQSAETYMKAAVDQDPNDLQNVYPLATAYLAGGDSEHGICWVARAAAIAPAGSAAQTQIQSYGEKLYKNYHGSDDGWAEVLNIAKASPDPDCKITKYVPPTPAEQAHDIVKDKTPDQIKQLSFGEWELVLSAGSPEDQAKVWDVIKNTPLQMEGNVVEATSNTQIMIAGSEDDIEQKRADITLTMTGPIPATRMPKAGDTFDFEGTPNAYTPSPFMMTMLDGKLLKKAGAPPAPKKPVHRRPAHAATR